MDHSQEFASKIRVQIFELTRTSQNNGLAHLSHHEWWPKHCEIFIKATNTRKKYSKIRKTASNGNKSPS